MSKPIHIDNIDPSLISLDDLETKKYGSQFKLKYNGGRFPNIEMPNMTLPSGVHKFGKEEDGEKVKFVVYPSFQGAGDGTPQGERLKRALAKCKAMESRIFELLLAMAKDPNIGKKVFTQDKGKTSAELLRTRAKPVFDSYVKGDQTYAESFKCELQRSMDDPRVFSGLYGRPFLLDFEKQPIPVDIDNISTVLGRGSTIKPVIHLDYIFISGSAQMFKVSQCWRIKMMILVKKSEAEEWDIRPDEEAEDMLVDRMNIDKATDEDEFEVEEVTDDEEDNPRSR